MKKETFNKLSLKKKMEIYNEWLIVNHLEDGFRSLTEEEIKERFENKDFLCWLGGMECINQVKEFKTLLNLDKRRLKHE